MPVPHQWFAERSAERHGKLVLNRLFMSEVESIRSRWGTRPSSKFGQDLAHSSIHWLKFNLNDPKMFIIPVVEVDVALLRFDWGRISVTGQTPILHNYRRGTWQKGMVIFEFRFGLTGDWLVRKLNQGPLEQPPSPNLAPFIDRSGTMPVLHREVRLLFPSEYPNARPILTVVPWEYLSAHAHHWLNDGGLCIYPDGGLYLSSHSGYQTNFWLDSAISWIVWHFQTFCF